MVKSNPFPAIMGRVCPAPCEDGCNRNEVEDYVGINSVEHYVGDYALEHGFKLPAPGAPTGKKVAVIGGGPAGLACAYFLRRKGHAVHDFRGDARTGRHDALRHSGLPHAARYARWRNRAHPRYGRRGPHRLKVGVDVTLDQLEKDFDAVFLGIGAQAGTPLDAPGAEDANNCISGIAFLDAFNEGRLQHGSQRVLVIGGGDTAMDVAAVARRLGHIEHVHRKTTRNTSCWARPPTMWRRWRAARARKSPSSTAARCDKMPATKRSSST